MSASNWTTCPKCKRAIDKSNKTRIDVVQNQYGKIPAEEFVQLLAKAEIPIELEDSFREDYEIWIDDDGTFGVSYRGSCQECNAGFEYTETVENAIK